MTTIIRRDDVTLNITCRNKATGVAMDITGYTIFFTLKQSPNDTDDEALIKKTITSHSNPAQGITSTVLSQTDTDIGEGDYVYDFQLKDGSGNITSSERGYLTVVNDITVRTT